MHPTSPFHSLLSVSSSRTIITIIMMTLLVVSFFPYLMASACPHLLTSVSASLILLPIFVIHSTPFYFHISNNLLCLICSLLSFFLLPIDISSSYSISPFDSLGPKWNGNIIHTIFILMITRKTQQHQRRRWLYRP